MGYKAFLFALPIWFVSPDSIFTPGGECSRDRQLCLCVCVTVHYTWSNVALLKKNLSQVFERTNCIKKDLEIYSFLLKKVIAILRSSLYSRLSVEQYLT